MRLETYVTNKEKVGIENQCAKMILAVIFLSYPFVSTTMFHGMACRDLDSEESWLVMDMQIDCLSAGTFFTLLALIGICAFPIGIPVLTLMGLLKYSDQVKDPQSAVHERVEFLVGGYKPAFFFCAESLKRLLVVQVDMPRPSLVREVRTIIAIASLLCAHIPRRYGG